MTTRRQHGYKLAVELEDEEPESMGVYALLSAPDFVAKLARLKDHLGLRDESLYIYISEGDGGEFGRWESTTLNLVHRINIYAKAHEGFGNERVIHTLAHEIAHVWLHAHGMAAVQCLLDAEPNEHDTRLPFAMLEQALARANESMATRLCELFWERLLE